jgi:uncharacterized protein YjbJ (UPF0337 family)
LPANGAGKTTNFAGHQLFTTVGFYNTHRRWDMDKDRVKGTVNDAAGRAKRQVGEWTGDTSAQVEGAAQQVKGKAQKAWGEVKDAARDVKTGAKTDADPDREKREKEQQEANREHEHAHSGHRE